jgi:hypothetical protein
MALFIHLVFRAERLRGRFRFSDRARSRQYAPDHATNFEEKKLTAIADEEMNPLSDCENRF